jgi:hypothetical protein
MLCLGFSLKRASPNSAALRVVDHLDFSTLLFFYYQVAEPLSKPFDSQETLGLKTLPNGRVAGSDLNKFGILFLGVDEVFFIPRFFLRSNGAIRNT